MRKFLKNYGIRILGSGTLVLDLLGLTLISLNLFSIHDPIKFVFDQPYGIITDLQPVADAINSVFRDLILIKKMRIGFYILAFSLILKIFLNILSYFENKVKN